MFRSSAFSRFAGLVTLSVVLPSCGGTVLSSEVDRRPQQAMLFSSSPVSGEVMAGVARETCGFNLAFYSASGTATGPYPGTFTASGSVTDHQFIRHAATITSGHYVVKVSGSETVFFANPCAFSKLLPYNITVTLNGVTVKQGTGFASITVGQGRFRESL